ncbi:MAG: glutamate-1-semialdehyde 2,1-aminomutase [Candidatus Omnitrophica bacterium]|nr:glutamate-1-semialdehyde 2,1-aminomutase [Candidatus Omnitrophota bacterium]
MNPLKAVKLFEQAQKYIPSGVNSPVRAFLAIGGTPVFIRKGKGPFLWDESGKKYLDFCMSWGALIFGHAAPGLIRTLRREIANGTSFGASTKKEVELARAIQSFFPSMEKIRLVSSGTEAVMSAIRLARGFTGRKKILKIDGGYHGHVDSLLVKAGSGAATFGIPDSAGIPEELAGLTLSIPFNDFEALEEIFRKEGKNLAAFILEPVPANMGVVLPEDGYLKAARQITKKYGTLLIFDEVITGFRLARGGAQESFGIQPDLTCLGKILGGGLPIAAFGGWTQIMNCLAPAGPVYQAGTLSGNPVAVTAALWMLEALRRREFDLLYKRAEEFTAALDHWIMKKNLPLHLNAIGSMFTLFFTGEPVIDYASAKKSDTALYAKFFHAALKAGIYLAPSQFETNFVSTAHSSAHLKQTLKIFEKILSKI